MTDLRSPLTTALFSSGEDGYHTYRIPSLLLTAGGSVLAICEGRVDSGTDFGDINLVLRRSDDDGRTWSEMQLVADDGDHTIGNPCPVVDQSDGTIWLPVCRDNKRVLLVRSDDDGLTWSEPLDISEQVMDPAWHWVGTGPGHGIQLASGRLLIPCWADGTEVLGEVQSSFAIFSDDGGSSWQRSALMDRDASDECEAVELTDRSLYMAMRSRGGTRCRAFSRSEDGGATWSAVEYDPNLPDPSCQGSIIRVAGDRSSAGNRFLLACPASPDARECLTIWTSFDECRTWRVSKVLCAGWAAYSDLVVAADGSILCFYETSTYKELTLSRLSIDWLTEDESTVRTDS